jgi:hypothetical protein
MSDKTKDIEDMILSYLYQKRTESPQSLMKIKTAVNLENGTREIKILKPCLANLIEKELIKKQVDRGNYKIDVKGIEYMES